MGNTQPGNNRKLSITIVTVARASGLVRLSFLALIKILAIGSCIIKPLDGAKKIGSDLLLEGVTEALPSDYRQQFFQDLLCRYLRRDLNET